VPAKTLVARPAGAELRRLDRRKVLLGEGLTLDVVGEAGVASAELIDLTPEGFGLVLDSGPQPTVGEGVTLVHTGRATSGIRQRAVVRSVGEVVVGGRSRPRLGLAICAERTGNEIPERRRADRHACAEALPALASAVCPIFFREWLHFRVTQLGGGGMTLVTSIRNKALFVGLELDFALTLPITGVQRVRGRITAVRREGNSGEFTLGVAWLEPSRELLVAVAEYLLLGDKELSPSRLRKGGLEVGSVERAVACGYASTDEEYREILALRLRAHKAAGRLDKASLPDMASPYDAHSRHIICRFGERIVGCVRVIYVEGDPSRSQYVQAGAHEIPSWLWEAGFVEGGGGATDPDFQHAGLYLALLQHSLRVAVQSGYRYMVGACGDELLGMYREMGFEVVETRSVEPKPGWSFRSHLLCLDTQKLLREPPAGKQVSAMVSAIAFAGSPQA